MLVCLCVTSCGQLLNTLVSSATAWPARRRWRDSKHLTLGCISAGAILHQNIVEGLMVAMRQAVHVHVANPLVPHHAGGVPAIDHTVVAVSVEHQKRVSFWGTSGRWRRQKSLAGDLSCPLFITCFYPKESHFSEHPDPLHKSSFYHQQSTLSGGK